MPALDRWNLARNKLSDSKGRGLVSEILALMRTHENARWLVYSSHLSDQIPTSHAAHAFSDLQRSVLHYEIVRLCTFWDQVDLDSRSIPTIVALADSRDVSDIVYKDHYSHYEDFDDAYARRWGNSARRRLRCGIRGAKEIASSDILTHVRNYRDRLAHQLERTRAEAAADVPSPRYGDEKWIYERTITTIKRLYVSLSGASMDWSGAKAIHKRNADSFWNGVKINVLR